MGADTKGVRREGDPRRKRAAKAELQGRDQTVLLLIDDANIAGQVRPRGRLPEYKALRDMVTDPKERRFIVEAILFSTLPVGNGEGIERYHHALRCEGFIVFENRLR